ncbi:hypothetical protein KY290_021217 [Solanum tuberosum]|uniref:Uncharacterized protein n=1 Tax=Solanum tuberosum TaxID=4113 RepID=A0ABQ7V0W8_SOLTU|nr:hypothetical protein KY290_021217 [Solanum tuberosum]
MCCKLTNLIVPHSISLLLQDYEDVFPKELPSGLPPLFGELSTKLISCRAHNCQTSRLIEVIRRTPKTYKGKFRNYSTRAMGEKV